MVLIIGGAIMVVGILVFAWSLCRASAQAQEMEERMAEKEHGVRMP